MITTPRPTRQVVPQPTHEVVRRQSLNLMCPWVVEGPSISFSWESEDIEDQAWELVGRAITGLISGPEVVDPKFQLSGGVQLSVQADNDFDPWTLSLTKIIINGRRSTQVQSPD